jgi:sugar lactone lactonase YvrE
MVNPAGIITTFAGSNVGGFSGDTGPANQAELNLPTAVAVDSSGNVYICDSNNNAIREVINGTINTVGLTQAYLLTPEGVTVDASGNIFVADTGNERIVEFTAVTYNFYVIAGTGVTGFAGDNGPALNAELADPKGVAVDSQGYVYIADTINSRIRKVGLDGVITTIAGTGQPTYGGQGQYATTAPMSFPAAVALDPSGNVYLADTHNNVVRMLQVETPSIQINGVVNSADFLPTISKGALASIAGVNFSSGKATATLPLPLSLGEVTVTVNGVIAPILYVQPTLINF